MSTKTLNTSTHIVSDEHSSPVVIGFWVYIMSDLILFACLFATYAVLVNNIADGPSAKEIFQLPLVLAETFALLFSSITYGFAMLAVYKGHKNAVLMWLGITFLFGLSFISMELYEFNELIHEGYGPHRSGFLSAFFTLVATHGLHVTSGLIWMSIMIIHIIRKGITARNTTRLMCLSLFWHFLDIVWICVFTFVYLMGAMG